MAENRFLITPAEVIALAFDPCSGLGPEDVPEEVILSAQEKFVAPVLNGLYARLEAGELPGLAERFVRPALAHYVRLLLLPVLGVSVGKAGVVVPGQGPLRAASAVQRAALVRAARAEARALMCRAVRQVEEHPDWYPEYRPERNVLRRLSIASRIVL